MTELCSKEITDNESYQVKKTYIKAIVEIQAEQFDIDNYAHLFDSFNLDEIDIGLDFEISEEQ